MMSCQPLRFSGNQTSALLGHNEPSELDYSSLAGSLLVVPEYDQLNNVIAIEYGALGEYNDGPLLKDLLNTPIERVLVTMAVPEQSRARISPQMLQGNKDASLKMLYKLTDQEAEKIDLLYIETPFIDKTKSSTWARDFGALSAVYKQEVVAADQSKGKKRILYDFNYQSKRYGDNYSIQVGQYYRGEFKPVFHPWGGKTVDVNTVNIPLYLDLGNFINTRGGWCFSADQVVRFNNGSRTSIDNPMKFDEAGIKSLYADSFGCDPSKIILFPSLPYEATGHIDLWAKFLSEDVLIIGELQSITIDAAVDFKSNPDAYHYIKMYYLFNSSDFNHARAQANKMQQMGEPALSNEEVLEILATDQMMKKYADIYRSKLVEVREFLEQQVQRVSTVIKSHNQGPPLQIVRIPMPAFLEANDIFRSYVNSLLVQDEKRKVAVVPRFFYVAKAAAPDRALSEYYEQQVISAYGKAGYEVIFSGSEGRIRSHGSIHCSTMQMAL